MKSENCYYPACSLQRNGRQCNKKVTLTDDGIGWCETCQQKCQPEYRWILQVTIADMTGNKWITAFGDTGDKILGMSANQVKELENTSAYDATFTNATFQDKIFKLKIFEDTYNEEKKIKATIVSCNPVDYTRESSGRIGK